MTWRSWRDEEDNRRKTISRKDAKDAKKKTEQMK
jgi:hypothetical protein